MPSSHMPSAPSAEESIRLARAAVEAGDILAARRLAQRALASHPTDSVASQSRALLQQSDIPWDLLRFGVAAAVCFIALVLVALLRSGHS
jgi:hypothetical protein